MDNNNEESTVESIILNKRVATRGIRSRSSLNLVVFL